MKNILFLFYVFLLLNCNKPSVPTEGNDTSAYVINSQTVANDSFIIKDAQIDEVKYEELKDGYFTKDFVDGNLKARVFYQRKEGRVNYYQINIFENRKKIQTIKQGSDAAFYTEDYIDLTFEDANFDDKKDLLITKFVGMNFDQKFLFLNVNGKFIKKKNFDNIINPIVNTKNKEINSEYHVGPFENHTEIYKWKNGKLMLVSNEITGGDY